MELISDLDYPKQYIVRENKDTKIYKNINDEKDAKEIDDFQWKIVSTITEKIKNTQRYTLIQHEDKQVGWINFNNSIQIFRFKPEVYRFVEENFINNEINGYLGIEKDFKVHFSNKLLTIKSVIDYNGEKLLGIFIKDKFFGFHNIENFEKIIDCNISLPESLVKEKDLYKYSKMENPIFEDINIIEPKLISIFLKNKVGRVKVNEKDFFWISLNNIEEYISTLESDEPSENDEQKYVDDLFYAIDKEREQSKEIVKTVLSAQDYMKSRTLKDTELLNDATDEYNLNDERVDKLTKENVKLKKELRLLNTRFNHQKDYNTRLEAQKEKYKARMILVEEKLRKLSGKTE